MARRTDVKSRGSVSHDDEQDDTNFGAHERKARPLIYTPTQLFFFKKRLNYRYFQ